MRLRYFAWMRACMGCDEEWVDLPAGVKDVGMLFEWLEGREERYARAFEFIEVVNVSVNQTVADRRTPVCDSDEVMLVPPIAGG